ncbi:MAG TPA: hypothetical protein VEW28_03755 [Candidatus Kapabacteria bacterium]|nr:hypothetical protein [Candidatus Kapabacteria bacterium]
MKKCILSFLIAITVLVFASPGFAQRGGNVITPEVAGGWLIGPVAGINLVTYSTDKFAILNSEPGCFEAQNGSDVAPFFGVSALLPLNAEEMQNFIIIEALYDSKSSKFTSVTGSNITVPTKLNGVVGPGTVNTSASATLAYAELNLGYKYNFTQAVTPVGPSIQLCASVGFKISAKETKSVTVSAVNGSSNVANAANLENPSGIRIGLRGMFAYDIPISETWVASPMVGYDLGLTKVASGATDPGSWKANSAFAGVAFRAFVGR